MIDGVILTPLKTIKHPSGNVYHGMKKSDAGFSGFGEAYFSTVTSGAVKAWKKHLKMTLNLVVPVGGVKFVIYDDRDDSTTYGMFQEIILSRENYQRLTIPPGVWAGFQGVGPDINLLLNVANIEHDPAETERVDEDAFSYDWGVSCS